MLLNVEQTHSSLKWDSEKQTTRGRGQKGDWVPVGQDTMSYSYLAVCPYTGKQTEVRVTYKGVYKDNDNFEWIKSVTIH